VRDRYIWAHRVALARSVHDMAKQMYANKKYSDLAWLPLNNYLFDCDESTADERGEELTKFNKDSTEFFQVVAQCLWNLANGSNVPWGRAATQPSVYDRIPASEKVIVPFFFVILKCCTHICAVPLYAIIIFQTGKVHIGLFLVICLHCLSCMCVGLGFCFLCKEDNGKSSRDEHVTFRQRGVGAPSSVTPPAHEILLSH